MIVHEDRNTFNNFIKKLKLDMRGEKLSNKKGESCFNPKIQLKLPCIIRKSITLLMERARENFGISVLAKVTVIFGVLQLSFSTDLKDQLI